LWLLEAVVLVVLVVMVGVAEAAVLEDIELELDFL